MVSACEWDAGIVPREDEIRDAAKEAIREFLDEKFATFGKWSLMSIMAVFLVAVLYFIVLMNGWHK